MVLGSPDLPNVSVLAWQSGLVPQSALAKGFRRVPVSVGLSPAVSRHRRPIHPGTSHRRQPWARTGPPRLPAVCAAPARAPGKTRASGSTRACGRQDSGPGAQTFGERKAHPSARFSCSRRERCHLNNDSGTLSWPPRSSASGPARTSGPRAVQGLSLQPPPALLPPTLGCVMSPHALSPPLRICLWEAVHG